jgi:GH35 family endo-1,4-beta-xylanase
MLRFSVFDSTGPAASWPLELAHLLGPDDVALPCEITLKRGALECRRSASNQAAALCVQYDAGSVGTLMLQTCLLPERAEPYGLSLELARHRIKTFIVKSEEWQMFDLAPEHPAMKLWEEARRLLTVAINLPDPLEADRTARRSLIRGIEATERLAMAHAEVLLHRRYATKPASSVTLGARVWPEMEAPALRDFMKKEFDVIALPTQWNLIEAEEGTYAWETLDGWMEWAQKQGKPIVAGPLLTFSRAALPRWMYVWQHDYDTCRDLAYDFVDKVVSRYKDKVGIWNVCSGLNVNDNFEFTAAQMLDLTRMAALFVRQAKKGARVLIELEQPFGEFAASNRGAVSPLQFIDQLIQEGIRLDSLGLRLIFGSEQRGMACRDLMQISGLLDRFASLEIPVLITAMGVPSEGQGSGGQWHGPWSPELHARWATRALAIALSKPFVESVFWADLFDHEEMEAPMSGLITADGKAKPALKQLVSMRRRLRKPLGPLKLGAATPVETEP